MEWTSPLLARAANDSKLLHFVSLLTAAQGRTHHEACQSGASQ